jgi:hypothetical protein
MCLHCVLIENIVFFTRKSVLFRYLSIFSDYYLFALAPFARQFAFES